MSDKPTLRTVAQEAGVSVPTVSQVLRGTGRISEQTRDRVLEVVSRLRYVPDSRAAAMRSGDNREIGFVINRLQNPFNAEVIGGVVDLLEAEGYLVSVVDTRDDAARQSRQLDAFIRHGRGGILWVPAMDTAEETYEMLAARGIPTVTFMRQMRRELDHVGVRDAEAVATATRHLIALGHRHIAYLGGIEPTVVRSNRIAGYHRALQEAGLGGGLIWTSEESKIAGMEATIGLRKAHPEVTGIVCNGDMVALGACLALIRLGQTPGRDVSVIGFDDIQDAAVATPPLTTMAVHPHKLGRKLARVLLDRIREPGMPATVTEISADLVLRETAGPPPGH